MNEPKRYHQCDRANEISLIPMLRRSRGGCHYESVTQTCLLEGVSLKQFWYGFGYLFHSAAGIVMGMVFQAGMGMGSVNRSGMIMGVISPSP